MIKRIVIITLTAAFLMLAACDKNQSQNTSQDPAWVIPKPGESTGVVIGRLVDTGNHVNVGGTPYLSENITAGDKTIPPTISFSVSHDPRAFVNLVTGEFYFKDVEPASNYVITILFGPGEMYIVRERDSENPLRVVVEAGRTLDLGDVVVISQ